MMENILEVRDLRVKYRTPGGLVHAVNGVSLEVARGEIVGMVGESGSGKSQTGYAIMGLIDRPGYIDGGEIMLAGRSIAGLSEREWRNVRGRQVAMIFQDPMMTLNPVLRIDTQIIEAIRAHRQISPAAAREEARMALGRVGIAAPEERLMAYPHQLSGGMRQRIAIAIALVNRPELVIADEPTTALDVTVQAQILAEVQKLCKEQGTALIWITHDLSVVAGLADRICVMYGGRLVESGHVDDVLDFPRHPYTRGLMDSIPSRNPRGQPLRQIRGGIASAVVEEGQCAFRARCDQAQEDCGNGIYMRDFSRGQRALCLHPMQQASRQGE